MRQVNRFPHPCGTSRMLMRRGWSLLLPLMCGWAVGCSGTPPDDDTPGDTSPTPTFSPGSSQTPGTSTPSDTDSDGDGFSPPDDCNDADGNIYPGAPELCDSADNDCDNSVDEDGTALAWPDQDLDGYGDANATPVKGCELPQGYVRQSGDCNDQDGTINPASAEVCDGLDNNCDGNRDEGLNPKTWYPDADADGYGASDGGQVSCEKPAGYVSNDDDCDDSDPASNPLKSERCDGRDNDCDGVADDGLHFDVYFQDADGDGYGDRLNPVMSCGALQGVADDGTDCDDTAALTHPNAPELCDGLDNNCNGPWDEGREGVFGTPVWYKDQDGDGFGAAGTEVSACTQPVGWVLARGDCDDAKAAIHPGADDPSGDGIDQDCGGTAGAEPHVGLSTGSKASIQAALDAAVAGATVWVGPGTYLEHNVSFGGKALTLAATTLDTAIDGQGLGPVVQFVSQETSASILDGFSITGGRNKKGGGIAVDGASPTLRKLTVSGNHADEAGGGIYLNTSSAVLTDLTISGNEVSNTSGSMLGGGIATASGNLTIQRTRVLDNRATEGGGIYSLSTLLNMSDSVIARNVASVGGGISLPSTIGKSYAVSFSRCMLRDNRASSDGGGISLRVSGASLSNCTLVGNRAREHGGGINVASGNPSITNCTFLGNRANSGGGLDISGSSTVATVKNGIAALNDGYNLYVTGATVNLTYTDLFSPVGPNHNLETLPSTNLTVDPAFITFRHDLSPYNDDDHLASGSPLRNKADPATSNPDGARADLGAYGGLDADRSYYLDADGDGMYGGWELAHGLDPKVLDGVKDPDVDGATNAREFYESGDPQDSDTDDDGALDGAEVNAGADPADWYSQPGVAGAVSAEVPGDFETLQGAIDAVQWQGKVVVGAGSFAENLVIDSRDVVLTGAGADQTVLEVSQGTGLSARWSVLALTGLGVRGGQNDVGGAISLFRTDAEIDGLALENGQAGRGAGLYANLSTLVLSDALIEGGCADADFSGVLELVASSSELAGVQLTESICPGESPSDGLVLQGGEATVSDSFFSDNGGLGVALYQKALGHFADCEVSSNARGGLAASDVPLLDFTHCTFSDNTGGPGLYLYNTDPKITDCTIENNVNPDEGGGLYLSDSGAVLTGTLVRGNSAKNGGGLYVESARPTIQQCMVSGNQADNGGGVFILDSTQARVSNSIVQDNQAVLGGGLYLEGSTSTVEHSALERNSASQGGGIFLEASDTSIQHVAITGNSASYGGGIYVHRSNPSIGWSVVVGNEATVGGGIQVDTSSASTIHDSILAFNVGYNLYGDPETGLPIVTYSNLYAPSGQPNHVLETLDPTVSVVEPGFLSYGSDGLPSNLHLSKTSSLVNAGDPALFDPDFSRADMGLYGGDEGAYRDLDGDLLPDWFWPGSLSDAPLGYFSKDYDCDDRNASIQGC